MKNPNHPPKGSSIKAEPIRQFGDIHVIKALLTDKPRDLCLFTIGINTNLRISELLKLKAGQVRNLKPGDSLFISKNDPLSLKNVRLNKNCIKVIHQLLETKTYHNDDYLFLGERGVLTVPTVNRMIKTWCKSINLKGNYGCQTLRKTFGYQQRVKFGVALTMLSKIFNHSCQNETMKYLCINNETIRSVYENEI